MRRREFLNVEPHQFFLLFQHSSRPTLGKNQEQTSIQIRMLTESLSDLFKKIDKILKIENTTVKNLSNK